VVLIQNTANYTQKNNRSIAFTEKKLPKNGQNSKK
jgi:hypothetical protein